eukprot:TRINITY_DN5790_c0_g1_i1.p1 TRINITY_DN5790_c0_g1~~TRINITY_DN5790_c0_g1_i1.p1  ORF type:complete len:272 (+),score=57.09 TRINITY_DN5790_c0_g1_i1:100-915(+)
MKRDKKTKNEKKLTTSKKNEKVKKKSRNKTKKRTIKPQPLSLIPKTWSWVKIEPVGRLPEPRYGHTLTEYHDSKFKNKLLCLGGSDQVNFSNELFCFSWEQNKWELVKTNSPDDDQEGAPKPGVFPKRHFHTTILYHDELFVFGGKSNGYWNDIWKYNTSTQEWTKETIDSSSKAPFKRYGHSAVVFDEHMWIFGGFDSESWTCDDLWKYSFEEHKWTQTKKDSKTHPPPRFHHSAVVDYEQKKMFIFGGCGESKSPLNDMWSYDLSLIHI